MHFLEEFIIPLLPSNPVLQGLIGGIIISLLNTLGALLILVWRKPSERALNAGLGLAAGVMLTASFTSLILPGIEYGGLWPVVIGVILGALSLDLSDHFIPHKHFVSGKEGGDAKNLKVVWLFIIAITLHNMPEGLAVGVGFGAGNLHDAITLMLAIGIQNIPEGLAVAVSSRRAGLGTTFYAVVVGIRSGLVEIPAALFGAWAVQLGNFILPYAMGFAAGAMLYVISDEIIPETHREGYERVATLGTLAGILIMLILDVSLG
ncbi:MAG TPA: ZIP family metal transporter [Thermoanaerobaculia bacterium]|nr:ZIP family metal transporter [Thermoanaerobaculia bacterium]HUM29613.1 ZIP family metal transporter [Thermoanaerobaculia bacterium]HXK67264.1 ZIP family metal transporter [Thermoanaerobaculia bacterium]